MQAVSEAFKTAALARTAEPTRKVEIFLVDNLNLGASLSVTADEIDATLFPKGKAINGIILPERKWALADPYDDLASGGRCFPDQVYPIDVGYEGGWWGNTLSDTSYNIGGGGEAFTITYSQPTYISQVAWWADLYLAAPVDFAISYDVTGSGVFVTLVSVTGWAAASWSYDLAAPTQMKALRINITKINQKQAYAKLLEFQGGLVIDVTSRFQRADLLAERSPDTATIEVGNSSANSGNLALDNTDGAFTPHNVDSAYQAYLRGDRRLTVKAGYILPGGASELIPMGTFYSTKWDAPGGGPTASVAGMDRMKKLQRVKYRTCPLSVNQNVDAIIKTTLQAAGLGVNEYIVNPTTMTLAYAWCSPSTSFFSYLTQLAQAAGGVIYFDQNDVFHFEDAAWLQLNKTSAVITLTDDNATIQADDTWDEADVKNRVVVSVNALKLAASAQLWALQETLTVPAGGQLTVNITFQSAATGVTTPSVTGGAHISIYSWTAYAMGGVLVLANSHTADETVTAITVSGQALQSDGTNIVTVEDTALVQQDGARELSLSNPFIQKRDTAQALANSLLTLHKNPPSKLKVRAIGLPHLELGDMISVLSAQANAYGDYWLLRHSFHDDGGFSSDFDLLAAPRPSLPRRATMWHKDAIAEAGGAIEWAVNAFNRYWHYAQQNSPAVGDRFSHGCWLESGVYIFSMLGTAGPVSGIMDWLLDGVKIVTDQDWYSAGYVTDVTKTATVAIAQSGWHKVEGLVTGKNGSSSNFYIALYKYWLRPLAD